MSRSLSKRTRFLERMDLAGVLRAAGITRGNMARYGQARQFKYFCAVCWRMIGEAEGEQGEA